MQTAHFYKDGIYNQLTVNNAPVNEYNAQKRDRQSSRDASPAHTSLERNAILCRVRAIVMYNRCSKERGAIVWLDNQPCRGQGS